MKKESITHKLLRLLDGSAGMHSQIAAEAGFSQATISRIYLRKVSPSLRIAEALLAWFEAEEKDQVAQQAARVVRKKQASKRSALRLTDTKKVRPQSTGPTAASALA